MTNIARTRSARGAAIDGPYSLTTDASGNWFVIPKHRRKEWRARWRDSVDLPTWAHAIGWPTSIAFDRFWIV